MGRQVGLFDTSTSGFGITANQPFGEWNRIFPDPAISVNQLSGFSTFETVGSPRLAVIRDTPWG